MGEVLGQGTSRTVPTVQDPNVIFDTELHVLLRTKHCDRLGASKCVLRNIVEYDRNGEILKSGTFKPCYMRLSVHTAERGTGIELGKWLP